MSEEYKSTNTGLLNSTMVKDGDILTLIEDAYSTFSEKKQTTYWNVKVELPDGTHKLAGLMDFVCESFAIAWGNMSGDWTGHQVRVSIRTARSSGNEYIVLVPVINKTKVEYPKNDINPNEIPF